MREEEREEALGGGRQYRTVELGGFGIVKSLQSQRGKKGSVL